MATNNPKNLSQAAETPKNNGKSSKIKNLLLNMCHLNQKILAGAWK